MPIKFTKESIKKYLDNTIRFWRKERSKHISLRKNHLSINVVTGIIDAFQSVRVTIFGSKLK